MSTHMKEKPIIGTLVAMLPWRVALLGLTILVFNSITGHQLYHVNTLKLFLLGIMISILWIYSGFMYALSPARSLISWQWGLLLLIPTLGFLPGGWLNPEDSVYFPIELITDLLIVSWAVLLVRHLVSREDIKGMLLWLVLLSVVVVLWVASQAFATHPLTGEIVVYSRPEGSFGNVNYLAGFLAVLTPMMVVLALPELAQNQWRWGPIQRLCTIGAGSLVISAVLAYSRAAIVASFAATLLTLVLVGLMSSSPLLKRLSMLLVGVGACLIVALVVMPLVFPSVLDVYPERFALLYSIDTWWPRLVPFRGAVLSIVDSPWFGWGLGASYNLNFTFMPQDAHLYLDNISYNHLHNEFLEMLQEGGFVGFGIWAVVIAVVVIALLRYAKRQSDAMLHLIALGIVGGLAAFYIHGLFSVAQRMIVVNLPLYTLLGMGGALLANERDNTPWLDWGKWRNKYPFIRHLASWQLAAAVLLLMWATFYPWIRSYSGMVRLGNDSKQLAQKQSLYQDWPNPYGLSMLLNSQLSNGQFEDALVTARQVDAIIPNYRNLPLRMARAQLGLHNFAAVKALGLKQYQLARYLPPVNQMLAAVAVYEDDSANLRIHLENLIVHAVISNMEQYQYPKQVQISDEGEYIRLNIQDDGRIAVDLPQAFVQAWFTQKQQLHTLVRWVTQTMQATSADSFFLPDVVDPNALVQQINQLGDEPKRVEAEEEEKKQLYFATLGNSKKSSFGIKADLHRISADIRQQSNLREDTIIDTIQAMLEEADLSADLDAQGLVQRIQFLRKFSNSLMEIARLVLFFEQEKRGMSGK